jgi:hypothetical protein
VDVRSVDAPCEGDLGVVCAQTAVPDVRPVNLTAALARTLAGQLDAELVLEAHVLPDVHVDGFAGFLAIQDGNANQAGHLPSPTLLVRMFDASGHLVWEDQQALSMPLSFDRDRRSTAFSTAVDKAASEIVDRLATHLADAAEARG